PQRGAARPSALRTGAAAADPGPADRGGRRLHPLSGKGSGTPPVGGGTRPCLVPSGTGGTRRTAHRRDPRGLTASGTRGSLTAVDIDAAETLLALGSERSPKSQASRANRESGACQRNRT